jgi:hypothetical protein
MGFVARPNGYIRSCIQQDLDGGEGDCAELALWFAELEIEAQPDLAGLPVSALQIDNKGDVVWLARGAFDARQSG